MSPVLMVPEAMPLATLQRMYYDGAAPMLARTGPLVSKREAETDETIPLDKYDYITRSTLVTTPIIFQERSKPRAGPPRGGGGAPRHVKHRRTRLREAVATVKTELCVPPYRCAADVMEKASVTMSCPGEHTTQWEEFGLEPYVFGKKEGFGELLYSVTDSVFLFRNGKVTPTFRFIDSLTSSVQVLLVFYTPKTGTTSLLSILADFDGVQEAKVFVTLDHYAIVEGTNLNGAFA
ncbi:hypothetical protein T484DRAFT_1783899 [Baffinella frigidus]|nr:hypothetical protein T484DRAFT_1783899 [Cryptophyta sp. CCMP2293]